MSKAPKYSFRVVEKRNNTWTAEIQRQATSKKKVVSKRQTGFASENEGTAWAEQELTKILENHVARNKRHDEERAEQYQDKLKQAELAATKASLEDDADATEVEELEQQLEQSFSLNEDEQQKAIADLQELEALETAEVDEESGSKLKFDFEIELEEAEEAEKTLAKKRKMAKAKKANAENEIDASTTVDGSEEVNSIYLKK